MEDSLKAATGAKKEFLKKSRKPWIAIHEVYYNRATKKPNACTLYPVDSPFCSEEKWDDYAGIVSELRAMANDIERYGEEILNWEDIGSGELVKGKQPEEKRNW